jgi:hypothetical protein
MVYCPQRTVQSIDKYKQKNAEIRRVTSQCCTILCPLPTAGLITTSDLGPTGDPTYDTLYSYTVNQTNGTSFKWFYVVGESTILLSDGGNVSGSQTPILLIKTKTIGCPPNGQVRYFVCNVSNNCGSAGSQPKVVLGCGF